MRTKSRKSRQFMERIAKRELARQMKEHGLDKIDRQYGNHPFLSPSEVKGLGKQEKVVKFIRALVTKDYVTVKALSEGVDSAGGFQVPEEFAAEVNRIVEDFGLVRKLSRKIPMSSDTLNVPRLSASVSVSFPGENTAGTESEPVRENVQLLSKTAVGLTVESNEMLADANIDIVALLAELFGEALAGEEDLQGFVGTGAPFQGIIGETGTNIVTLAAGKNTFEEADADDYRDGISQVKPWSLQGAAWFLHRTVWGAVQKLKDSNGAFIASALNPIMNPVAGTPQSLAFGNLIVGTLWGYPVYLSDKLPATSDGVQASKEFAIFGNLTHLYMGTREGMNMSISDSATVGTNDTFAANQSALRVTERFALSVGLPAAFAVLKTNAV